MSDESSTEFTSDHPDTSRDCYPCMCPDCPGYHFCTFYRETLTIGDEASCEVCGERVRVIAMRESTIQRQMDLLASWPKDKLDAHLDAMRRGHEYQIITTPHAA